MRRTSRRDGLSRFAIRAGWVRYHSVRRSSPPSPPSGPPVVTTGKTWPIPATCQSPSESRNIRCCIWFPASGSIAWSICCAGACRGSRSRKRSADVTTARAVATDRCMYMSTSPLGGTSERGARDGRHPRAQTCWRGGGGSTLRRAMAWTCWTKRSAWKATAGSDRMSAGRKGSTEVTAQANIIAHSSRSVSFVVMGGGGFFGWGVRGSLVVGHRGFGRLLDHRSVRRAVDGGDVGP